MSPFLINGKFNFSKRAKGRAAPILKPYSTITIILSEAKQMESHGSKS
ncbi:hypothetical protein N9779_00040 [Candidatus Pelagibacter ubique]|nr:hypothetical protein [Candidatus Pelagibacter ubique]